MESRLLLAGIFLAAIFLPGPVISLNCNCAPNECYSRYGYCGTGDAYCGKDCRCGPCFLPAPSNDANVADIVSPTFLTALLQNLQATVLGEVFTNEMCFLKSSETTHILVDPVQSRIQNAKSLLSSLMWHMRLDVSTLLKVFQFKRTDRLSLIKHDTDFGKNVCNF